MNLKRLFSQIYFRTTGHSFTHLGRMFLRLFVGLMLLQFGIRQLIDGSTGDLLPTLPLVAEGMRAGFVIFIEIICAFFIMIGLFMRAAIIPPFILMILSSYRIYFDNIFPETMLLQMMTVPFLFMGIFMFLLLVGPGKISVDYFFSLYLINRLNQGEEEDLEEV
ncbi:MAG: DoxX family protein [Muribaculaceae bacterium]|nr:DoxX family protein [Muribaculaceae bacterium]